MTMNKNCVRMMGGGARLLTLVLLVVCVFAGTAQAQRTAASAPQFEISGAYSYVRANAANSGGGFNVNGGSGSFTYNFSDRFSLIADAGAYRFSELPPGLDSTMYAYLFGPRYSVRRFSHVTPFAQVLLGGGRLNANSAGVNAGENGFAMAAGGGLDLPVGQRLAIRLFEADYLMTRFAHPDGSSATQNNVRLSVGLVFRFGNR